LLEAAGEHLINANPLVMKMMTLENLDVKPIAIKTVFLPSRLAKVRLTNAL